MRRVTIVVYYMNKLLTCVLACVLYACACVCVCVGKWELLRWDGHL